MLHGDAPPKRRAEHFDNFNSGECRILIATDVASRGLDMRVNVEHVILYDFPRNVIDYIHRIGRTARAGNNGYVTAFIGRTDQSLAEQIKVTTLVRLFFCTLADVANRKHMQTAGV